MEALGHVQLMDLEKKKYWPDLSYALIITFQARGGFNLWPSCKKRLKSIYRKLQMEAAHHFKKRKQNNYITLVFIAFSQNVSFLCTLVVQSVSWMFFNIFTPFGINRTALQVRSGIVFSFFCTSDPRRKLRFHPWGTSGLCFYHSQELWGLWRLVFQNFTVSFQVPQTHQAADNDSTPAVSETSRGLERKIQKEIHKLPTNSSLWWSSSLSEGIF